MERERKEGVMGKTALFFLLSSVRTNKEEGRGGG